MLKLFNLYMPKYFEKNKLKVISFLLISIIFIVLESIVAPYYLGQLISNIKRPYKYFRIIIIIYFLVLLFFILKKYLEKIIISFFMTYPRSHYFQAIIDKYSHNYKSIKLGSNISKINSITQQFKEFSLHFITEIGPYFIVLFGIAIFFLFINLKISLMLFLIIILIIIISIIYLPKMKKIKIEADETYYQIDNNLTDIYSSLINTYLNNNEVNEKEKINNDQNMYQKKMAQGIKKENNLSIIIYFITLCIFFYIIFSLLNKKENNQKSTVSFIIILIYFLSSCLIIGKRLPWLLTHYCSLIGNYKYLQNLNNNLYKNNNNVITKGDIYFKNINFYYNPTKKVINNLSLKIPNKHKVAIIGKSGSGKSSLALLILKLYSYHGNIYIDSNDIQDINTKYLRYKILYCNQKTMLYDTSILNNMKYGNNISEREIINILEKYDLIDIFNNLSSGIHHNAGVLGNNLSGGMQKVVMILRTLLSLSINNPYIVIFDEPLVALDVITKKKIIKIIVDFCKDKTLIIITHDNDIIPYMDKVIDFNKINR